MTKASTSSAEVGMAQCALHFTMCTLVHNQKIAATLFWAPELGRRWNFGFSFQLHNVTEVKCWHSAAIVGC